MRLSPTALYPQRPASDGPLCGPQVIAKPLGALSLSEKR